MLLADSKVAVGQTWRHKRDRSRRVKITGIDTGERSWGEPLPPRVHVTRNTSRRTQAIKLATLVREYELYLLNEAR